jgi:dihydropteroate synthase
MESPKLMGIVNVTPDSFSDGGLFIDPEKAIAHILELIKEGADIIDIGAESTRPGSPRISEKEEWSRLKPVLELMIQEQIHKKVWISLDTYKSSIAEKALKYEVDIMNDISAGSMDPQMMDVVSAAKCPYIMMHMKGTPETMQKNPEYRHVMDEIIDFFEEKIRIAQKKGIEQLILDPGIGFGKRLEDNYEIIRRLEELTNLGYPILLGVSRKSFLWKKLKIEPKAGDHSTTIVDLLGIQNRAHILRIHHVGKHMEMLKVFGWVRKLKAT